MSNETGGYKPPETENFKFFSHKQCEYFPCHELKGGKAEEDFNCLFCYCPLYALGEECGGKFAYYKGIKDCSNCLIPHSRKAYDYITSRFKELVVLAQQKDPEARQEGTAGSGGESAGAVDSPEKI